MMISSQPLTFEILRSVDSGVAPHHRSPASATEPAGQDLWAFRLARVSDSTAPIAGKCQSFLDNVVAQFGDIRARNYRAVFGQGAVLAEVELQRVDQELDIPHWIGAG